MEDVISTVKMRKLSPQKINHLPKVRQLVSGGPGIQTEFSMAALPCFSHQLLLPKKPARAVLNLPFTGRGVPFSKSHQSLGLSYLFCIMGEMALPACCGGMLRKWKELRCVAVFRKGLRVPDQTGSLSLLVFHPDCWSFLGRGLEALS